MPDYRQWVRIYNTSDHDLMVRHRDIPAGEVRIPAFDAADPEASGYTLTMNAYQGAVKYLRGIKTERAFRQWLEDEVLEAGAAAAAADPDEGRCIAETKSGSRCKCKAVYCAQHARALAATEAAPEDPEGEVGTEAAPDEPEGEVATEAAPDETGDGVEDASDDGGDPAENTEAEDAKE